MSCESSSQNPARAGHFRSEPSSSYPPPRPPLLLAWRPRRHRSSPQGYFNPFPSVRKCPPASPGAAHCDRARREIALAESSGDLLRAISPGELLCLWTGGCWPAAGGGCLAGMTNDIKGNRRLVRARLDLERPSSFRNAAERTSSGKSRRGPANDAVLAGCAKDGAARSTRPSRMAG